MNRLFFFFGLLCLFLMSGQDAARASCPVSNAGEFYMSYDTGTDFLTACAFGDSLRNVCATGPSGACGRDGDVIYDGAVSAMLYCRDGNWYEIDCLDSGDSCAGTTAGTIGIHDSELQYCNGTNWFGFFTDGICSGIGVEEAAIGPSGIAESEQYMGFGEQYQLGMDDTYAVIGGRQATNTYVRDGGAAVFKRSGTSWSYLKSLEPSVRNGFAQFGSAVAIDGQYIIVGAYGFQRAFIFKRDQGGADNWGEVANLSNTSAQSYGLNVDIDDDIAVVGAYQHANIFQGDGSVSVYRRDLGGADNWGEVTILRSPEAPIARDEYFGWSVGVAGDYIVVGAMRRNEGGITDSGSVYLFKQTSTDTWTFITELASPSPGHGERFGMEVDIIDLDNNGTADRVVVAEPFDDTAGENHGFFVIYERDQGGAENWGQVRIIYPPAGSHVPGRDISLTRNDMLVVGQHENDTNGTNAGNVMVFKKDEGGANNWGFAQALVGSDTDDHDWFGYGVSASASGNYFLAGSQWAGNGAGNNVGKAYFFNYGGTTWSEQDTAVPPATWEYAETMGQSVAISGDYVAVGANLYTNEAVSQALRFTGGVHIYKRASDGSWSLEQVVTPDSVTQGMQFGDVVDMTSDTLVVAVPGDNEGAQNSGGAQIFGRNIGGPNNWGFLRSIDASDREEGDFAGGANGLAIFGDRIIMGARLEDGTLVLPEQNAGAAYIFYKNEGGVDNWGEVTKISPPLQESGAQFGWAVDIAGDYAAVSSNFEDAGGTDRGAVYIFEKDEGGTDNWGYIGVTHKGEGNNDRFGYDIAMAGTTLAVGALFNDSIGTNAGAVYIYEKDEGGTDNWGQVVKITSPGTDTDFLEFGFSVGLAGDILVVGARADDTNATNAGRAYVFSRDEGGADNWGHIATIEPDVPAADDFFGWAVAASGNKVVATAPRSDETGTNDGIVYMFGCP